MFLVRGVPLEGVAVLVLEVVEHVGVLLEHRLVYRLYNTISIQKYKI